MWPSRNLVGVGLKVLSPKNCGLDSLLGRNVKKGFSLLGMKSLSDVDMPC